MQGTEPRFAVRLLGPFENSDLLEMSEMQLFGYLNNRLPDGYEPEGILEELAKNWRMTAPFGSPLGTKGAEIVRL